MIADLDPIKTTIIIAQFENFLGTAINPAQVAVSFAPRTDEALLEFKSGGNNYELYLHREARALVREAAVRYNEDFDARRLDSKLQKRRSERVYGEIEGCFMRWGLGTLAMNGEVNPKIAVGYRFEKGSPYFAITVYGTTNPLYKQGKSSVEKSVTYHIYMNKAQALDLADALDEAALMRALDNVTIPAFEPDSYEYADDDRADAYGAGSPPAQSDVPSIIMEENAQKDDEDSETSSAAIDADGADAY